MDETATPENLDVVLARLGAFLADKPDQAAYFCGLFDELLDELSDIDFFGTEGQCDPRGDRRDW